MLETLITIIAAFAGTNIDDIFIDTILFAQADSEKKVRSVIAGKYFGMGVLVLLSILGAYFLHVVPQKYIEVLGLIPIALGIKELLVGIKNKNESSEETSEDNPDTSKGLLFSTALVTVSNGADNIGVYIPLFASYTFFQIITVIIIFAIMTAVWCFLGKKLSDLPGLQRFLMKHKLIIVPAVYIILGIYIILESI